MDIICTDNVTMRLTPEEVKSSTVLQQLQQDTSDDKPVPLPFTSEDMKSWRMFATATQEELDARQAADSAKCVLSQGLLDDCPATPAVQPLSRAAHVQEQQQCL